MSVIDLERRAVLATVGVGLRPYAVALAGDLAFSTDQYAESVSVIDLTTMKKVKTIEVGGYPEGIGADPAGRYVYVACWDDNTVQKIDVTTLEVVATTTVRDGPRAFGHFLGRDVSLSGTHRTDGTAGVLEAR